MVKTPKTLETEVADTENIIDEYRQGISQAIEKERNKLREFRAVVEQESKQTIASAYQEADTITTKAKQDAEQIATKAKGSATKRAGEIIADAEQKASSIIKDTEGKVKREAKEKTRREVERVIRAAKEKAEKDMATARQAAAEISSKLVSESRQEADKLANILTEKAQREAEQIIQKAKERASKEGERESVRIIAEARQIAEQIVAEAKNEARTELEESTRLIMEAQRKLAAVIKSVDTESAKPAEVSDVINEESTKLKLQSEVTPASTILGEGKEHTAAPDVEPEIGAVLVEKDEKKYYKGSLAIEILPPLHSRQIDSLEKLLLGVPYLRLAGKGGTESGKSWLGIEISEPLPLLMILEEMPLVKEVFAYGKTVMVKLKA